MPPLSRRFTANCRKTSRNLLTRYRKFLTNLEKLDSGQDVMGYGPFDVQFVEFLPLPMPMRNSDATKESKRNGSSISLLPKSFCIYRKYSIIERFTPEVGKKGCCTRWYNSLFQMSCVSSITMPHLMAASLMSLVLSRAYFMFFRRCLPNLRAIHVKTKQR